MSRFQEGAESIAVVPKVVRAFLARLALLGLALRAHESVFRVVILQLDWQQLALLVLDVGISAVLKAELVAALGTTDQVEI